MTFVSSKASIVPLTGFIIISQSTMIRIEPLVLPFVLVETSNFMIKSINRSFHQYIETNSN